jgi:hypothetical protein
MKQKQKNHFKFGLKPRKVGAEEEIFHFVQTCSFFFVNKINKILNINHCQMARQVLRFLIKQNVRQHRRRHSFLSLDLREM